MLACRLQAQWLNVVGVIIFFLWLLKGGFFLMASWISGMRSFGLAVGVAFLAMSLSACGAADDAVPNDGPQMVSSSSADELKKGQPNSGETPRWNAESQELFYQDRAGIEIPDDYTPGLTRQITVTGDDLHIARVTVDIRHSYMSDLYITLTNPAGATVVLHDRRPGRGDELNLVVDDVFNLSAPPSAGVWTLRVADVASRDLGILDDWSLLFDDTPIGNWGDDRNNDDRRRRNRSRGGFSFGFGGWDDWDDGGFSFSFGSNYDGDSGYGSDRPQACYGTCWYGARCTDYCPPGASCTQVVDHGRRPYWQVWSCSGYDQRGPS